MRPTAALALLAALLVAGCETPTLRLPPGFVPFDKAEFGTYHLRAVSADGIVVGLKSEPGVKEADLDFWTQALTAELTENAGYRHAKTEAVSSEAGLAGRLLTFTVDQQGVEFTYLVALFLKPDRILIAEAGGKTAALAPKLDDIRKALLTVR